jgi:AcrR family transcriptional regulator
MSEQTPERRRVSPRQARAQASVEAVVEAAAQVLEASGEDGFNTNAVAERAGVSIGTLYRYFPDKQAILLALAKGEKAVVDAKVMASLSGATPGVAPDRAAIRAFLQAFDGRTTARRAAVQALLDTSTPGELSAGFAPLEAAFIDAEGRPLSPVKAFVLSRALHGAMRAAVLEDAAFLSSREFEDELVHLARSFFGFSTRRT